MTPALHSLAPGDVLCGRFHIVRLLARGGVGEVYEAEDLTLRAAIALKTLRPELAREHTVLERFRREIVLARQVTHPNVCRSFDVFEHATAEGPAPGLVFVTMELLNGENLAQRLRRDGPLPIAVALPLVTQMASGLAAAHAAGVVHRDFKSANVMLVPHADGLRAVITDFGLARSAQPGDETESSLTGTGALVGTSAYMAPEQVEGADVTAAADMYAFGIVLYEMVTGKRPFSGASTLALALSRLKEAPASPRAWVPDLDERWEAAILACLERDPARRPTASALAERLAPVPRVTASILSRRSARRVVAAGLFAILAGCMILARPAAKADLSDPAHAATRSRRSVALLGFRNLSQRQETAWLSTALAETLRTELSAGDRLNTISGEEVARMRMEMPIGEVDSLARDTLRRVRNATGADLVVLGSYLHLGKDSGGRIRLDVRIQEAATGETLATIVESGTEEQVFDLVSRTGSRLRGRLGIDGVDATALQGVWAPATPEALRLYAEGVARLRVLDALGARTLLEAAVAADGDYFPARVALSEAWSALGYQRNALQEAKNAFERSANASPEQRLVIEARYRESAQEWGQALRLYETLHRTYPDNLDYGLRLASTQIGAARAADAQRTLAELRARGASDDDDPRIDLAEAEAQRSLSDFRQMLATAQAAVRKGRQREAHLVVAKGLIQEGRALQLLGQTKESVARFEEARRAYERIGDVGNRAWTSIYLGTASWTGGDPAGAEIVYREALAGFRKVGDQRGTAAALNMIGMCARKQGRLDEATRLQDQSLATFREIDDRAGVARLLNNRAGTARDEGDLGRAARLYEEALVLGREAGTRREVAAMLSGLGTVLVERGELEAAHTRYTEALAINEAIGLKTNAASDLYRLGDLAWLRGDLAEARRHHARGLAMREETKEELAAAESRLALAALSIEEGRPAEAEAPAQTAALHFAKMKAVNEEAFAHAVSARAHLAQGRPVQGREAIRRAMDLARKSQTQNVRLSVSLLDARLRASGAGSAEVGKALRSLERVLGEARKHGRVGLELEARLAIGELGGQAGRPGALAALETLEKEAAQRGFLLVSRKAAAARQALPL